MIGSIVEYLFAPDDPEAVIEKLAAQTTRIVSLTVTEGGYHLDHVTGEVKPETIPEDGVFGFIVDGARPPSRARRRALHGDVVRQPAGQRSPHTAGVHAGTRGCAIRTSVSGSAREVRFPNSMVDRITPQTTDADRDEVRERFGIEDAWPVVCEPFTQWVLEDVFTAGRPPVRGRRGAGRSRTSSRMS